MKIAFLAAANSPHTIKWANALAEDHDVTVFSLPEQKDEQGEFNEKVTVKYLPFTTAQGGYKKNAAQVKSELASGGFGVVNAFGATTYGVLAAKAKAPNVLLTVLGPDVYEGVDRGGKGLVKKSVKHASGVLAAAPNVITRVQSVYKKEQQYFVVPFGVDTGIFKKTGVEKPEDSMCFGSLKALEYGNGVDLVMDAFAKYLEKTTGAATLKIVGTGSLENNLRQKAQNLGIADKVEFTGYVKNAEIPAVLNTMDATVQMGSAEAFGVPGIESMACEVPVVASDTVGASEYILNGVTGYLVKIGNVDRCCDCMMELRNKAAREHMGELARGDVKEEYELKDCKEKYEHALRAVGSRVM
ncbi:glycosyltransferase [Christensenella tenuis]|uniref:Glycosyltransferase n=1 Tax=Christensenella tenuis TaxID=2763033 RepID=A0ABR7EH59_9FIRM|nr:glycosyltransferase [Christensenella tenuis]MBC5649107.1 glycosyltransferase [Christensenella tenuis]